MAFLGNPPRLSDSGGTRSVRPTEMFLKRLSSRSQEGQGRTAYHLLSATAVDQFRTWLSFLQISGKLLSVAQLRSPAWGDRKHASKLSIASRTSGLRESTARKRASRASELHFFAFGFLQTNLGLRHMRRQRTCETLHCAVCLDHPECDNL